VDYATAKASGLTFASVKNKDGDYVAPSPASAAEAANEATLKPNDTFSAIWAAGAASYPITYLSFDLISAKQPNAMNAFWICLCTSFWKLSGCCCGISPGADAGPVAALYGDPRVMLFITLQPPSVAEVESKVLPEYLREHRELADGLGSFAAIEKETGQMAGRFSLKPANSYGLTDRSFSHCCSNRPS
jgi:hypothetical protein